jgi:phytol kinase
VPGLITLNFALIGLGLVRDPETVSSMSRSGKPSELLYGPLFYGLVFVASTVWYWRSSPAGVVALMVLCVGDGLAALVGSRLGRGWPLPHNRSKSWVGSAAFFVGAFVSSYAYVALFHSWGWLAVTAPSFAGRLLAICGVCTLAESLAWGAFDNVGVFAVGSALGHVLGA